ncbi:MAG: LysR family transcriptional regulator [Desulfobaccales bacterium]
MDLNLLVALDALLRTESVTAAARRMNLSVPAMSRTLARIRDAIGDPILVRAGRKLVPTPRALVLRGRVQAIVEEAQNLLQAGKTQLPGTLERTFTLRSSDAFAGTFAARLVEIVRDTAPQVVLRFAPQGEEDVEALREGKVDLDLGVIGAMGPEVRLQMLFRDCFVGVVRQGHALARAEVTAERFAGQEHISVSRRGQPYGPIDKALEQVGLSRRVALVVPTFYGALAAAAASDLVAAMPRFFAESVQALLAVHIFPLPVTTEPINISQAWHPRFDADPAHRWLRECVRAACKPKPQD